MERATPEGRLAPRPRAGRRAKRRFSLERLEERRLLSSGLVAAYSFDEGSGTTLHDASGDGNNGTITNANWSTAGKFGDALSFSGASNSWVTVPDSAWLNLTTGMTLEAWVDPTSLSSSDQGRVSAISKDRPNSSSADAYALNASNGTGKPPGGEILVGGAEQDAPGSSVLPLNTWSFLATTYDGTTLKLYVNGNLVGQHAGGGIITTTGNPLRIGGDLAGAMFTGRIDNVRIYNTPLTQSQVQADMTMPVAPAVASETPARGASNVPTNTALTAKFNEPVVGTSITTADFTLKGPSGSTVAAAVSYNASTQAATLTPSSRMANLTTYTATIGGVTDGAGHAMTAPFSWSFTTGPAPAVVAKQPAPGTTGIALSTAVTATFNEPVQSGSIGFTLTSRSGNTIAASLTYNASTLTATLTPTSPLAYAMLYTATVSGAKDAAGDPMSGTATWSFTTVADSIWSNAAAPSVASANDPKPDNIGVEFYSDVAGSVTGIRFYKGSINTGTHIGSLWTSTGTLLAQATFTNETASGWQQVSFSKPVAITAGTTYVASYHTNAGDYAFDSNYFASEYDSGPLHVPAGGGVFAYSTAVSFPTQSWESSNYWVDVMLAPSMDSTTLPAITSTAPASGSTGVNPLTTVTASFNEAALPSTIAFTLKNPSGAVVPTTIAYNSSTHVVTLTPSAPLAYATTYKATVSGTQSCFGVPMAASVSWSFTTAPASLAPKVIGESPAPNATGVMFTSAPAAILPLTATFGQPMQPGTIDFTLANSSGNPIATTFWYSDATDTATLSPEAELAGSTKYIATVSNAESVSGYIMAAPVSWSFTTASAGVTTPAVLSTSPPSDATSVDVATPIAVNFNEPILASSVTSARFTLKDPSGHVIAASISYSDTGDLHTATLKPSAPLAYSTAYTATISGVKAASGASLAGSYTWSFVTASGSQNATQLPLVYQSNLQYLGGFRVPNGLFGPDSFNYAGQGLAYDPANNSLFMSGYAVDSAVAQISIPGSIVDSSDLDNLATATVLQPFVRVLTRIPNPSGLGDGTWATQGPLRLGGLMVANGQLIGTEYVYYDQAETTTVTHFRFDSLNLATAPVEGMFTVSSPGLGGGFFDGYMDAIPSNWQSALGSPDLTGQCCLNVIGRTSSGPAVFGFNPATLSTSKPSSATPYLYYTLDDPGGPIGSYNPIFTGNTTIQGVFFAPGSRSVLFFGSVGTNQVGYGLPGTFNDSYRTAKGWHSLDGDYAYQVWAYDADDLLAVEDGRLQPWQVQPYAVWNLDFPQFDGSKDLGGVAFDPSTGRLYVTQLGGDTEAPYSYLPVVQVFQLTLNPPASSDDSAVIGSATGAMPPADTAQIASPSDLAIATHDPTSPGTITSDSVGPEPVVLGALTPEDAEPLRDDRIRSARPSVVRRATMVRTQTILRLAGRMSHRARQAAWRIERHAAEWHPGLWLG